jgi:hypothetical protein
MVLYTATYIGNTHLNDYKKNEVYFVKIVKMKDGKFLLRNKQGEDAIIYDNADLLKADWAQMQRLGIMEH